MSGIVNRTGASSGVIGHTETSSEVLLNTYKADNSSTTIAITGMSLAYDTYKFVVSGIIPAQDSVHIYWFLKKADGTKRSSGYRSPTRFVKFNGSTTAVDHYGCADSLFGIQSILSNAGTYNGIFYIYNPADSGRRTHGTGLINFRGDDSYTYQCMAGGLYNGLEAHTEISFETEGGNINHGTIRMYGVK